MYRDLMAVDLPVGESGGVRVERFEVDEYAARIGALRAAVSGHRRSAPVGIYTKLIVDGTLMMSDTPDEKSDHLQPVMRAQHLGGRCLVNGLGLGMVVQALLSLENVEHVDVVEIDSRVIDLVAPHYQERFGDRLTVIHADALEQRSAWPRGTRWSVAWHDIWPTISDENLPEVAKLKRSYGQRVSWQGAWAEAEARWSRNRYMY